MIPGVKLEQNSPCSPSTSVSSGSETSVGVCPICGDAAWSKHFGISVCNACSAFFRRTVAAMKSYVCAGRGKQCTVVGAGSRFTCKFCRFQRAVWSGMSITVAMLRVPADKRAALLNKPPLRQLVCHRKATFVNRFNATVNVYGGRFESVHIGRKMPTFTDVIYALHAEYNVMFEYLRTCGFLELGLSHSDLLELAAEVFYSWISFTSVLATAKNGGYATNTVFFVDESNWPVKEEVLDWLHSTCAELRDPSVASGSAFQLSKSVLSAATKLHYARLDDAESATMCQILMLKAAIRLFPGNPQLPMAMNNLFENLKVEYEQNFDDCAIRLGNLILLTNQIESITHQLNEYVVLLSLSGYETVLGKIVRSQQKIEDGAVSPPESKMEAEYSP